MWRTGNLVLRIIVFITSWLVKSAAAEVPYCVICVGTLLLVLLCILGIREFVACTRAS